MSQGDNELRIKESWDANAAADDFDVVVFNFALLGGGITRLLRAAGKSIAAGGAVILQTVHPLGAAEGRYEDG